MEKGNDMEILKEANRILSCIRKEDVDALSEEDMRLFVSNLRIMKSKLDEIQSKIG